MTAGSVFRSSVIDTRIRLALNADTTPLAIGDTLVFKSFEERAREAANAGFHAVNADRCEPGLTPEKVARILSRYSLEMASGFFHGPFYQTEEEERIYAEALQQAAFSRAVGQKVLFVSALVSPPERLARVGRVTPSDPVSLTRAQFRQMSRLLHRIARLWMRFGIRLCFHPHVATYVEAPHEIETLMNLTDPELVWLGPDTGHLLLGGADPLQIIERHFERLGGLHVKDVDRPAMERVRREGLNYRQACAAGVWTELGTGCIDFPGLFNLLRRRGWAGWVIVETDHTRLATALESSQVSRRYLKEVIGL